MMNSNSLAISSCPQSEKRAKENERERKKRRHDTRTTKQTHWNRLFTTSFGTRVLRRFFSFFARKKKNAWHPLRQHERDLHEASRTQLWRTNNTRGKERRTRHEEKQKRSMERREWRRAFTLSTHPFHTLSQSPQPNGRRRYPLFFSSFPPPFFPRTTTQQQQQPTQTTQ